MARPDAAIESIDVSAYTVPTDAPESDGTLEWDSTTVVVVEVRGGGATGLGYTYGSTAVAELVSDKLVDVVVGRDPLDVGAAWIAEGAALRNAGRTGVGYMAVSAVDVALWDLKARLFDVPVVALLPAFRDAVPTSWPDGSSRTFPA